MIEPVKAPGMFLGCGLVLSLLAAPLLAVGQEIFRTEDENGVVSFSDVATDGAEVMTLPVAPVTADAVETQQRMIDQQLMVAKALEESRLARQEARTNRLQALAATQPRTIYYREEDQYGYFGGYSYYGPYWDHYPGFDRPGHPGVGPPHPSQPINPPHGPPGKPPSVPVPLPPLN
ncbi:MAG: DUF4124 domain-containing protein [Pseudomonadales bacterium]